VDVGGIGWTQAAPTDRPSVRTYARTATDTAAGNVILYGGISFTPGFALNQFDVWTWSHGSWTLAQPNTIPAPLNEREAILDARNIVRARGGDVTRH